MFLIHCPYCDEHREEEEYHCVGQAHIPRPADPDSTTDEQWGSYLYFRKNPRGEHRELWFHAAGCGKYFNVARNTVSYEILATYKIGESVDLSGAAQQSAPVTDMPSSTGQQSGASES
ncbi:MAG: sarcosine oxidase subunit delta [Granulosicoccus sp.]